MERLNEHKKTWERYKKIKSDTYRGDIAETIDELIYSSNKVFQFV